MAENYALLAHLLTLQESTVETVEFLDAQISNPNLPLQMRQEFTRIRSLLIVEHATLVDVSEQMQKSQEQLEHLTSMLIF